MAICYFAFLDIRKDEEAAFDIFNPFKNAEVTIMNCLYIEEVEWCMASVE